MPRRGGLLPKWITELKTARLSLEPSEVPIRLADRNPQRLLIRWARSRLGIDSIWVESNSIILFNITTINVKQK